MSDAPDVVEVVVGLAKRACAYVRVSTVRQAEHETSLADQIASIERHCASRGIDLVEIYRARGASATDDSRPVFRSMIEAATGADHPYDLVVVHSFRRFFRDQFEFERSRRPLQTDRKSAVYGKSVSVRAALGGART